MDYRIISADDHIDLTWLPKDLWARRVPARSVNSPPKPAPWSETKPGGADYTVDRSLRPDRMLRRAHRTVRGGPLPHSDP